MIDRFLSREDIFWQIIIVPKNRFIALRRYLFITGR